MSEEEKKAIEDTKKKIKNTQEGLDKGEYYGERYNLEQEIKREVILLNLIDRLQIENERKNKIIDLLIDDFQLEGYLQFESKDDVLSYYNRRINLEEAKDE